jgi:hypothetical protein
MDKVTEKLAFELVTENINILSWTKQKSNFNEWWMFVIKTVTFLDFMWFIICADIFCIFYKSSL